MHAHLDVFLAVPVSRSVFFEPSGVVQNRCDQGHLADLAAKFCLECGEAVELRESERHTELFSRVSAEYGWATPEEGFSALVADNGPGWVVPNIETFIYPVKLVRINVESNPDATEHVYGLGLLVAQLKGIGEGAHSSLVMALPMDGFNPQTHAIYELTSLLGVDGSAKLYPQVSLS